MRGDISIPPYAPQLSAIKRLASYATPLRKYVGLNLVTLFAAWNMPRAVATCARLSMRKVYKRADGSRQSRRGTKWHVLLLPRARFTEDVFGALTAIESITVYTLPRKTIKAVAAAFLPDEVDDNNYVSTSPDAHTAMLKYRAFLKEFWRHFDPHGRIDAVITGNFGYCAERELAAALEELGIPFVALHKENSWSDGTQSFWEKIYRERKGPFLGRRILVYSPIERDLQLRAGVVDQSRIEVVGMPRLDEIHRWRTANGGLKPQPVVLFASFDPDVSMPVLAPDAPGREYILLDERPDGRNLNALCRSAHRTMVELARTCPDITIMVKSKGRGRDRKILNELLGVEHESGLPQNMEVILGGSPLPLLFRASVVCGLHSTMLVEALAAGRPVVVPWYAEVLDPEISRFIFDLGALVVRASSPSAFLDTVRTLALARTPVPKALSLETLTLLREWVGNDDGRAGERTAAAMLRILETRQQYYSGSAHPRA
jgi:hypothetical protein